MEDPTVFDPSKHADLLPQFAEIHRKCITSDFTIATFLPPLKDDRVEQYWRTRAAEVQAGTRTIIFMRAAPPSDPFDATPAPPGSSVAGVVMLAKPIAETGPMRGLVEKLLVDPSYRKMGIGKKLMAKLEEVARKSSRWLLVRILVSCLLKTDAHKAAALGYGGGKSSGVRLSQARLHQGKDS
jgi:ribosomal protein S18 acetylase RimI-like enzyme